MTVAAVATVVISLRRGKHFLFDRKSPRQLSVPLESGYFIPSSLRKLRRSNHHKPLFVSVLLHNSTLFLCLRSLSLHPLSSAHSPPPAGLPQQLKSVSLSFLFFSFPFVNAILPSSFFSSSLSISLILTIILFVPLHLSNLHYYFTCPSFCHAFPFCRMIYQIIVRLQFFLSTFAYIYILLTYCIRNKPFPPSVTAIHIQRGLKHNIALSFFLSNYLPIS